MDGNGSAKTRKTRDEIDCGLSGRGAHHSTGWGIGAAGVPHCMADKPNDVTGWQRRVEVSITKKGFEPDKIRAKKGEPIRLVVTRRTDQTCAKEIVIADAGMRKSCPSISRS